MSRLIVSNRKEMVNVFRNHNSIVGFVESAFVEREWGSLSVCKKLFVNNKNFYLEDDDYVAICGTLIYKGQIGQESLELLLHDYRDRRDLNYIRNNSIGNYLCCIYIEGIILLFCDPNNIYYGFYYRNDNEWAVSNSLYELANSIGEDKINIDEDVLLEESYCRCIIGNETIFKEIKRIEGDDIIIIDSNNDSFKVDKAPKEYSSIDISFDDAINGFTSELLNVCSTIRGAIGDDISISMTGGVDSRTVFSAFLASGAKPHLMYGIGNSLLAETKNDDKTICELLANKYSLPLDFMDWSLGNPLDKDWDYLENKYGQLSRVYSGALSIHDSIEHIPSEFVAYGYFGESYSYDKLDKRRKKYTIDDFLNYYIGTRARNLSSNYQMFYNHIKEKCIKLIGKTEFSADEWIELELYMRRKKDTVMINYSNQQRYSIAVLGEPRVLKYSFVPVDYKRQRRFLLNSINRMSPQVLEVPVFSHMEYRSIDKTLTLSIPIKMKIRTILSRTVRNNWIKYFLLSLDQALKGKKSRTDFNKTNDIVDRLKLIGSKYILPHPIFREASTNSSIEARYLMSIQMINKLKKGVYEKKE